MSVLCVLVCSILLNPVKYCFTKLLLNFKFVTHFNCMVLRSCAGCLKRALEVKLIGFPSADLSNGFQT